ncbi:hypothetical protein P280DRAFT_169394 [Massarina eburnea CBS 473.64]|uniref:Uncharacterized protein n=1 Tax=Massarina eburnea CBS 473.64 TaxID=1395130 RepID=A0A6A6RK19_9PLEO|nr:hypothetical protein P280DRAFT_169394 [Massarina eburnea CBS 473.64]
MEKWKGGFGREARYGEEQEPIGMSFLQQTRSMRDVAPSGVHTLLGQTFMHRMIARSTIAPASGKLSIFIDPAARVRTLDAPRHGYSMSNKSYCGISCGRAAIWWSMNGLPPPPVALSVLAEKTADFSTL